MSKKYGRREVLAVLFGAGTCAAGLDAFGGGAGAEDLLTDEQVKKYRKFFVEFMAETVDRLNHDFADQYTFLSHEPVSQVKQLIKQIKEHVNVGDYKPFIGFQVMAAVQQKILERCGEFPKTDEPNFYEWAKQQAVERITSTIGGEDSLVQLEKDMFEMNEDVKSMGGWPISEQFKKRCMF